MGLTAGRGAAEGTAWRAAGGIAGPVVLIATWALLGRRLEGYSPVHDPISRLAATHQPSQLAMTAGLVGYAIGVGAYAGVVRHSVSRAAGAATAVNAIATLGIAATPLDSPVGGGPHALAAGTAYASLAALPLLAAGPLAAQCRRAGAAASVASGLATAGLLLASTLAGSHTGLWQRAGLTIGHLWIMASTRLAPGPSRR